MSVDLPLVKIKQNTYQGIRKVIYSIDKWQSNSSKTMVYHSKTNWDKGKKETPQVTVLCNMLNNIK